MTLSLERARANRPVTWLTILGILLLPAVVGGILVASLYNPTERLDNMTAAIVNLDEPVEIDGQLAPLGRQLAAGLVEGSDELDSNLSWVISNDSDAAKGLNEGRYQAVVTIPETFSRAATSTGNALSGESFAPVQAEITVVTPPDGRVADELITSQIAAAASSTMGSLLSEATLSNVFLGFSTLGEQLGVAADGAAEWAEGANTAAEGATELSDGIGELAGGARQLSSGAGQLATGTQELANGAQSLATGANRTASGLSSWAGGARGVAGGTAELAAGLNMMADQVAQLPEVPAQLVDAAKGLAANGSTIHATLDDATSQLASLSANCLEDGGTPELCDALAQISSRASAAMPSVAEVIGQGDQIAAGIEGLAQFGPQLTAGLRESAAGATTLSNSMGELATGAEGIATGTRSLAGGMSELSTGASQLAGGARELSSGSRTLADGADAASAGVSELADGVVQLADGADTLASGLAQAAEELPSFNDEESASLASIVADPVSSNGAVNTIFGNTAVPLLASTVLWFGALASFLVLRSTPAQALSSRRTSAALAWRTFWPAAAVGVGQAVLVSIIVQIAARYDAGTWWSFLGFAVLAAVAFAAINQALVAVVGGVGRWVSALVGVLVIATGIISTVPGWLASLAASLPTAPALSGLIAGSGAAASALVVWGVLSFLVTVLAVATRRTATTKAALHTA